MMDDQISGPPTVRILLVDDDVVDRKAIERYVQQQRLAYHLVQTTSVAETRAQLAAAHFDVVILDYLLSDGTGLEILAELRDTPAIILTGSGREAIAAQAMRLGAYDYLIKDNDRAYLAMLPATVLNVLQRKQAERQARALQQLHGTILGAISEGILGVDWGGRILFANPAAEAILGDPSLSLAGQDIAPLLLSDGQPCAWPDHPLYATCRAGRRHRDDDTSLRNRAGRVLPVACTAAPLLDEVGQSFGAVITFEDISARKQSAEALHASEERLRTVIGNAPVVFYTLDEAGVFTLCDGRALREIGGTPDALLGRSIFDYYRDYPEIQEHVRLALAGQPSSFVSRVGGHVFANQLVPLRDEQGCVTGATGVATNITQRERAEETLRASEERFRGIFDQTAVGMALTAPDGRLLEVNQALCQMLGYTDQELLEMRYVRMTHPDDLAESHETIRRLLEAEMRTATLEKRYLRKDGQVLWSLYTTTLIRDATGGPLHFIIQMQDITARKHTEEALRASEERFRQVEQHAPSGLALVAPDGRFLRVNPALCALVGYSAEELLARTFQDITHPDDLDADLGFVRQLLAGEIATYQMEKRYYHRNGQIVWVLLSVSLVRDQAGAPLYFISQIQDIDARKRAEETLQAQAELLHLAHDAVIVRDPHNVITFWSEGAERMYGWAAADALGQTLPVLLQTQFPTPQAEIDAQLAGAGFWAGEVVHTTREGRPLVVESRQALRRDARGRPLAILGIFNDITERTRVEEALRASEERFRENFDRAALGMAMIGLDGRYLQVNTALCRITGYSMEELLALRVQDITPPEDLEATEQAFARVRAGTLDMYHTEKRYRHQAGHQIWVEISATLVRDDAGRPLHLLNQTQDITTRRHAEEALRESEQRYRTLIDTAQEGIWMLNAAETTSYVNAHMAAMLGYVPEEMAGRSVYDIMDEEGRTITRHYMERRRQGIKEQHDFRFRHKEGRDVWTLMGTSPIHDRHGVYVGALAMVTDITERKVMEEALRASEAHFRTLIEQAPVGACILDEHGHYETVNDSYCALYGYTREELLGRHLSVTVPTNRYADLLAMHDADSGERGAEAGDGVSDAASGEEVRTALARMAGLLELYDGSAADHGGGPREGIIYTKGGDVLHVLVATAHIQGIDGRPRQAAFIVDTSERLQAARALAEAQAAALKAEQEKAEVLERSNRELARSNAELAQFASVASHDLRSPLNTIGGYAQLVSRRYRGQLDTSADEFLDFIVEAIQRMQLLIDGLLAYARVGAQAAPPAPVACNALVEEVIAQLGGAIGESEAVVTHDDLPTVYGQALQLGQVFQNLIGNAVKFRNAAPPRVNIAAERRGPEWLFSVQDNGIGLDPAQAERIFRIFQRLHTQEEYPGTGLGLAVCKKIVEQHDGRIWIESQPGQGTRVLFTLPAGPPPPA